MELEWWVIWVLGVFAVAGGAAMVLGIVLGARKAWKRLEKPPGPTPEERAAGLQRRIEGQLCHPEGGGSLPGPAEVAERLERISRRLSAATAFLKEARTTEGRLKVAKEALATAKKWRGEGDAKKAEAADLLKEVDALLNE